MRNPYVDTTYTPTPFMDGIYRIVIDKIGPLYFTKPIESNASMHLDGRFADVDRKLFFRQKSGGTWSTPSGTRETWFTHTDSGTFGEPMNIIVKTEFMADEAGNMTWFWPKEVWLAKHVSQEPKQWNTGDAANSTLKNYGKQGEAPARQAEAAVPA